MANEITMSFYFKAATGLKKFEWSPGTIQADWSEADYMGPRTQVLSTSYEAVDKGDIANILGLLVANPDAAESVLVSLDAGTTEHMRVLAGHAWLIPLTPAFDCATNLRVKGTAAMDAIIGLVSV